MSVELAADAALLAVENARAGLSPDSVLGGITQVYSERKQHIVQDAARHQGLVFARLQRTERVLGDDTVQQILARLSETSVSDVVADMGALVIGAATFSALALQMLAEATGRDAGELAREIIERAS